VRYTIKGAHADVVDILELHGTPGRKSKERRAVWPKIGGQSVVPRIVRIAQRLGRMIPEDELWRIPPCRDLPSSAPCTIIPRL
jgi:hypothetical protein